MGAQIFLGFVLGFILTAFYEFIFRLVSIIRDKEPIFRIKGLHFHHSIYGLVLILFLLPHHHFNPFLLGMGVGIILRHTYSEDKLSFIDHT